MTLSAKLMFYPCAGAARNKEASTADESKAADSGPSLEEMLTPPTSMGLSSDTRMFTIT